MISVRFRMLSNVSQCSVSYLSVPSQLYSTTYYLVPSTTTIAYCDDYYYYYYAPPSKNSDPPPKTGKAVGINALSCQ